jgi:hypothetical protein
MHGVGDPALHERGKLDPLVLAQLDPRQIEHFELEAPRIVHGASGELPDHHRGDALFAARSPAEEIRGAELLHVLEKKGVVVRLERRLTEHVKKGHRTRTALVRYHQRVNFRLAHDDLNRTGEQAPGVFSDLASSAVAWPAMTCQSVEWRIRSGLVWRQYTPSARWSMQSAMLSGCRGRR